MLSAATLLEMLAVCSHILSWPWITTLPSGHRSQPTYPILINHRLDDIENSRLQRLQTRIMGYNFTAEWLKGSNNSAPDALSRNPVSDPSPHDFWLNCTSSIYPFLRSELLPPQVTLAPTWTHCVELLKKTLNINNYSSSFLMTFLTIAHNFCDHLTINDDLIVHGC